MANTKYNNTIKQIKIMRTDTPNQIKHGKQTTETEHTDTLHSNTYQESHTQHNIEITKNNDEGTCMHT